MEDIGLHPYYRISISVAQECHVCKRAIPEHYIDICYECGKPTCKGCIDRTLSGWFCVECVAENW